MLLRTQQNELAARILREGFNPHDFAPFRNRNTDDGSPVTRLTHTPSGFHIDFVDDQGVEFSPGAGRLTDYLAGRDFGLQFVGFCNWLDNLKRETEAPDLWAEPRSQKDLVALSRSDSSDNSPFTEIERRRVEKGIEELRHYLLESAAIELDRHEIISAKLDEATRRFLWLRAIY